MSELLADFAVGLLQDAEHGRPGALVLGAVELHHEMRAGSRRHMRLCAIGPTDFRGHHVKVGTQRRIVLHAKFRNCNTRFFVGPRGA